MKLVELYVAVAACAIAVGVLMAGGLGASAPAIVAVGLIANALAGAVVGIWALARR